MLTNSSINHFDSIDRKQTTPRPHNLLSTHNIIHSLSQLCELFNDVNVTKQHFEMYLAYQFNRTIGK